MLGLDFRPEIIRKQLMYYLQRLIISRHPSWGYLQRAENESLLDYLAGYLCAPKQHQCSLLVSAGVGTGKSTIAQALYEVLYHSPRIASLIEKHGRDYNTHSILCLANAESLPSMLNPEDFNSRSGDFFRICTCDILILDDLGVEPVAIKHFGTEWRLAERIISMRYDRMRPTIITTNLTPMEIEERYGSRMFDRMMELYNFFPLGQGSFRSKIACSYSPGREMEVRPSLTSPEFLES